MANGILGVANFWSSVYDNDDIFHGDYVSR